MDAAIVFFLIVFLVIVAFGVGVVVLVVVIYRLNRRVLIPAIGGGTERAETIIEDWAADHDYTLLELERVTDRNHPFADRFGFGVGKWPGIVYFIEVRTPKDRTRAGWIYMRVGLYGVILADTLEVAWDRD